ncbi:MAG: arginine--tRNA ligase, partial [Clostridia bacterium]|nr:arginine--tRNA ligase [Clostridia bacterium]
FYVNDAGNQVDLFGKSIEARYLQIIKGEDAVAFPENGYHGDDIRNLAKMIYDRVGEKYLDMDSEERCRTFVEFGLPYNISLMKQHLERYRIRFDEWFMESSLHKSGYVEETVKLLEDTGCTYEKDGALWLRNTDFGADKDEVLRRANGFYTYYAVDIAYHRNKFIERGFDRVIDVWGADHHGHAVRFAASMTAPALGIQNKKLDFLIMQMVRLVRGNEIVKVSKRTGKALTLNDLLDEIGVDACRFFFNAKPDTHLEFDLDLAIRQDSENPVYYVQYAHARICSLISAMAEEGHTVQKDGEIDASLLNTDQERELIKQLAMFTEEIRLAARDYDPSRINRFVTELAARFHRFYSACRIKDAEPELRDARLVLCACTEKVIANALDIVGVTAPEKM